MEQGGCLRIRVGLGHFQKVNLSIPPKRMQSQLTRNSVKTDVPVFDMQMVKFLSSV